MNWKERAREKRRCQKSFSQAKSGFTDQLKRKICFSGTLFLHLHKARRCYAVVHLLRREDGLWRTAMRRAFLCKPPPREKNVVEPLTVPYVLRKDLSLKTSKPADWWVVSGLRGEHTPPLQSSTYRIMEIDGGLDTCRESLPVKKYSSGNVALRSRLYFRGKCEHVMTTYWQCDSYKGIKIKKGEWGQTAYVKNNVKRYFNRGFKKYVNLDNKTVGNVNGKQKMASSHQIFKWTFRRKKCEIH